MSAYHYPPPRRRLPALAIAAGVVVVVLVALGVGLLLGGLMSRGGDSGPGAGVSPSASASGSASPSAVASSGDATAQPGASASEGAVPSPVVAAPEGLIPPGSVVRVTGDGLRMREQPSTDAALVQSLPVNQLLLVGFAPSIGEWGPVSAGGFVWYPVQRLADLTELPPLSEGPLGGESATGWVAAGDASNTFVELLPPRCPTRPVSLLSLEAMAPWEQLACLGNEPTTVEGTYGCGGCGGIRPGTFEPGWMAYPLHLGFLSADPDDGIGPFALHFSPDGPTPPEGAQIIRVTGHFDDAAAAGCTVAPGDPPVPIDERTAELYCREQFVMESCEGRG
jgi:hypothetical protein